MNGCIFCKILKGEIPSKKIYEDDKVIAILDVNPVVDGHTLIIPKTHITDFKEMPDDLIAHVYHVANKLTDLLMDKLDAKGITLGVNYGETQMVKHFHMHLLPNYTIKKAEKTVDEVYEMLK